MWKRPGDMRRQGASACSGQGEIRTHDTVAGMPVFETGAFNHSATCPTASKPIRTMGANQPTSSTVKSTSSRGCLPPIFEKFSEHQSALVFQQTALYLRRMVEPRVAEEIRD